MCCLHSGVACLERRRTCAMWRKWQQTSGRTRSITALAARIASSNAEARWPAALRCDRPATRMSGCASPLDLGRYVRGSRHLQRASTVPRRLKDRDVAAFGAICSGAAPPDCARCWRSSAHVVAVVMMIAATIPRSQS